MEKSAIFATTRFLNTVDDELICGQWNLWHKAHQLWEDLLENILIGIRHWYLLLTESCLEKNQEDFDSSNNRRLILALLFPYAYM